MDSWSQSYYTQVCLTIIQLLFIAVCIKHRRLPKHYFYLLGHALMHFILYTIRDFLYVNGTPISNSVFNSTFFKCAATTFVIGSGFLLLEFIKKTMETGFLIKKVKILEVVLTTTIVIELILFLYTYRQYQNLSLPSVISSTRNLVLILASCIYFFEIINYRTNGNIFMIPDLLAVAAILFYCITSIPYYLLNILFRSDRWHQFTSTSIFSIYSIMYCLFIGSVICYTRNQK